MKNTNHGIIGYALKFVLSIAVYSFLTGFGGGNSLLPIATQSTVEVSRVNSTTVTLRGTDATGNGKNLGYKVTRQPQHGWLKDWKKVGNTIQLTYLPDGKFVGTKDSFEFVVVDTKGISKPAIFTLNYIDTGDKPDSTNKQLPIAIEASLDVSRDKSTTVTMRGTDAAGNIVGLGYKVIRQPQHGSLRNWKKVGATVQLSYIPDGKFTGSEDSFDFVVVNTKGTSKAVTCVLKYTGDATIINILPLAVQDSIEASRSKSTLVTLRGTDATGIVKDLGYKVTRQTQYGSLRNWQKVGKTVQLTYIPNGNYTGSEDSLEFVVVDSKGTSKSAKITLNFSGVTPPVDPPVLPPSNGDNRPPVATSSSETTQSNKPITIGLIATDPDDDKLLYLISSQPKNGTLSSVSGNKVTYTPKLGFSGDDSFRFRVGDGKEPSNDAIVSIKVAFSNQAPKASSFSQSTKVDKPVAINLIGLDPDGDKLTYLIDKLPLNGSLSTVSGNKVTYTPKKGFTGNDSFTYKVSDSEKTSTTATVALVVTAGNQAPVASSFSITSALNSAVSIVLNGSDADGDNLSYEIVNSATHGSLSTLSGNKVIYTPNSGVVGNDSFKYRAYDGSTYSSVAEVTIKIVGKAKVDLYTARLFSETLFPIDKLDIVVSDTHAFIASGNNGINVFSKINTTKPVKIKNLWLSGEAKMLKLSSDKKTLFVASPNYGLNIVNVSDPAKATRIGGVQSFGSTEGIALSSDNRYVYLADDTHVVVVDVANLSKPKIIGDVKLSTGSAKAVALTPDNKYLLVASGSAGLHIVDISKPTQPLIISRIDTKGGEAQDVISSLNGSVAYVADGFSGVSIVNINSPTNPVRMATWNTKRPAHDVIDLNAKRLKFLSDGITLLVGMGSGGIYGLEVANPAKPIQVGSIDTSTLIFYFDISADESKLYGLDFYDGFMVYDIAN